MARRFLFLYALGLWILRGSTVNLNCLLCCCQNPDDDCQNDRSQQQANPLPPPDPLRDPNPIWRQCNSRPLHGQTWACEADNIDFPTVECLVQDIKTCDLLNKDGASTIFYSFGVATIEVRPNVRNKLAPKGVMFNDGLMRDDDWWPKVIANKRFHIGDPTRMNDPSKRSNGLNRNDIFVARMSEALARASTNDVYLVYSQEVGKGGKDRDIGGIYQLPLPIDTKDPDPAKKVPNAWRTWEFPTIQKHTKVKKIYGVEKSKSFPLTNVEWTRGAGQRELAESYASELELPPLSGGNSAKLRRDNGDACAGGSPSSLPSPTANPGAPKCVYIGPEPPTQPEAYCTCDGKSSLPLTTLKTNAPVTDSCSYRAQPTGSQASKPRKSPTPTTNKDVCLVCTPYAANEDDCTSMPNCAPIKGAATVEAGSSAVNVGTLTSDALYTSVSKALESICPPATQTTEFTHCSTNSASIKRIKYVADESLFDDGEFVVSVKSSQYNRTSLRDALIRSAATTAKFSTTDKNSYVAHYTVPEKRRWWHRPVRVAKRALGCWNLA